VSPVSKVETAARELSSSNPEDSHNSDPQQRLCQLSLLSAAPAPFYHKVEISFRLAVKLAIDTHDQRRRSHAHTKAERAQVQSLPSVKHRRR